MTLSVNIVNQALMELGVDSITTINDETMQASLANRVYDGIVDRVIAHGYFPSTIKRSSLAQLTTTPSFGYSYEYQLPSDCLRVVSVNECSIGDVEYKIENNKLLTDESSIKIRYVARLENESEMDPFLKEVLIYTLAFKMCMPLTQDKQLKREMAAYLKEARDAAEAHAGVQGSAEELGYSDVLNLR